MTILDFIEQSVEVEESSLITDEYKAYLNAYKLMPHRVIKHDEGYVDPDDKTLHTTRLKDSGACSSGRGMAPITSTPKAGRRCSWPRRVGNTTTGKMPTLSTASYGPALPNT